MRRLMRTRATCRTTPGLISLARETALIHKAYAKTRRSHLLDRTLETHAGQHNCQAGLEKL